MVNQFEPPPGGGADWIKGRMPVNVRVVNGIELDGLKVKKVDGKSFVC